MALLVHVIELVGTLRPGLLDRSVHAEIEECVLELEVVGVIRRVNVERVERLGRHRQPIDPSLRVFAAHLGLLIDEDRLLVGQDFRRELEVISGQVPVVSDAVPGD